MIFQLLSSSLLLGDEERQSKLYVNWDNLEVRYITTDLNGNNHQYFKSVKHPQHLTEDERHRVLRYCLSTFNSDEIVNYNDLFLQNEFIVEANVFKNYELTDEWLNL